MASPELDKSWDSWMSALSPSYAKTTELLEAKKQQEAAKEFKTGVANTVRKLYTEVVSVAPPRYSKMNNAEWSQWTRQLYQKTRKAEDVLEGLDQGDAAKLVADLRDHFYALHEKTATLKTNDYIYAFHKAADARKVDARKLAEAKAGLDKAAPSQKAKTEAEAYAKAKEEWAGAVEPLLADGKIGNDELPALSIASEKFYRAFGIQME